MMILTLFRYQIMLKCWEQDQNKRPQFQDLKSTFYDLMQTSSQSIRFPSPDPTFNYQMVDSVTDQLTPAVPDTNETAPDYDQLLEQSQTPSSDHQDFLGVRMRMRHNSEPSVGDRRNGQGSESLEKKNSFSIGNPYVTTPTHNTKTQVRRSFEWDVAPPLIRVEAEL